MISGGRQKRFDRDARQVIAYAPPVCLHVANQRLVGGLTSQFALDRRGEAAPLIEALTINKSRKSKQFMPAI